MLVANSVTGRGRSKFPGTRINGVSVRAPLRDVDVILRIHFSAHVRLEEGEG